MKNLYNSPFEYWEKIGYVGYNNYTDLHLNVKKKMIVDCWSGLPSLGERNTYSFSKNKLYKKNVHVLSFLFYNFFKNIHTQSFILKKIIFFFSSWKKKYMFFIKKHIKHRIIKYYMMFLLNKIVFSYLISLKKWHKFNLMRKKKKLYEYLSVLYNVPGTKKKIFLFKKILKSITKNYTFSNKHMLFFNNMFGIKKTNLHRPQYIVNILSKNNNFYEEKGIFKTIPTNTNNDIKKELTFFVCSTFKLTVFQLKKLLSVYHFSSWKDFFYFLHYKHTKFFFGHIENKIFDVTYFMFFLNIVIFIYIYTEIFSNYIFDIYTICAHLVE